MGLKGSFERNLDAKGRLSLPALFRDQLGEHVCVFKALDVDALYVFSDTAFDEWVNRLFMDREGRDGYDPRDPQDSRLMRLINKRAMPVDVDSAGRISLNEDLRRAAHLDREVTVFGNRDHLEIWDRVESDAEDEESDEDLMALFFRKKQ